MSGFLNWALKGLHRLLKNNKFSDDKTAEEIKTIMEKNSNPISAFAQDCLKQQDDGWISKDDMYRVYSEYVNEYGGVKVTKEKFGRDFTRKANYIIEGRRDTTKKKSVTGWINVGFKDNTFKGNFLLIYNKIRTTFFKTLDVEKSIKSVIQETIKEEIIEDTTPKDRVYRYIKDNPLNFYKDIQLGCNIPEKDFIGIFEDLKQSGNILESKPDKWQVLE